MPKEQEFKKVMEIIGEMWHDDVYTEVDGNWVEFQFREINICIEMWNGIISVYDNEENEEIYRVE